MKAPSPAAATTATATPIKPADTRWIPDAQWDGLADHLGPGMTNRLKSVDRAVYALSQISRMLFADQCGRLDVVGEENVHFKGFTFPQVEALQIAVIELGAVAEAGINALRENDHGCLDHLVGARQ